MQRTVRIVIAHRHVLQNGFKQRLQIVALLGEIFGGPAFEGGCIDDREVELFLGGAEFVEQIKGMVDDPVRTCAGTVDFVDDNDRLQSEGQCLACNEARLRHRAFNGINE